MTELMVSLDEAKLAKLDELAATRRLPREELLDEALSHYLAVEESHRLQIEAGIACADRGEFASDEDVARVFNKYRLPGVKIIWTVDGLRDLDGIGAYISQRNPFAADRLLGRIEASVSVLADFPERGRAGRVDLTRELVVPATSYIVAYRVVEHTIEIVAVFHAARAWPKALK